MAETDARDPSALRLAGLDTLRFFAALWVAMRHGAMPPLMVGASKDAVPHAVQHVWNGAISGPAAVIVFFVISGFCVHLPYAGGRRFEPFEYLVRRFVRVGLPMLAALAIWRLHHGMADFGKDWLAGIPAWSIVAEMVYYLLYPALRLLRRRVPWSWQIAATFAAAFAFAFFFQKRSNINYPAWGYHLNWILGLPVWLMGVALAEFPRSLPDPSTRRIWIERGVAVSLGAFATWLAWERIAGHHLTLNFFALFAVWWVRDELGYHRHHPARPLFEWAGTWSYSLYLVHTIAYDLWKAYGPPYFGHVADWILKLSATLLFAWLFFLAFERPSHRLARWCGLRVRAWRERRASRERDAEGGEEDGLGGLAAG